MYQRLLDKGVVSERAVLFANWADTHSIFPVPFSLYRNELEIPSDVVVALYSSDMGEKQGLEIVFRRICYSHGFDLLKRRCVCV